MTRTESKSLQVHPDNEQSTIDFMQKFGWSLLNSQDVNTVDNHLERKNDKIYSVTEKEHYVKLTFSRDLDMPNIDKIKALEVEYDSCKNYIYYTLFPFWWVGLVIIWIIGAIAAPKVIAYLLFFACIGGWIYNLVCKYMPNKKASEEEYSRTAKRKAEILNEVVNYI